MTQDGSASTDIQLADPGGDVAGFDVAVVSGPGGGRRIRVDAHTPDRALVGQSEAADLVIPDRLISRRHLALEVRIGQLFVEDLGSTNGTFIHGIRVVQALLRGGEQITLGGSTLSVTRAEGERGGASPPVTRSFGRLVGASLAMRRIYPLLERLASSDAALLLEGETGTGKELVAETLHEHGPRRGGPFLVFDCTTTRLAADAAAAQLRGAFEAARGGTLLLDEVGELPLELQPLLLRAVERSAARVIASTRLDLDRAIADGTFRDDLFYRLATTRLELPPLRQRAGDVGVLARHFWAELGGDPSAIPYEAFESLERAALPGNVRELMATVSRILTMGVAHAPSSARPTGGTLRAFCRIDLPYARAKEELLGAFEREYVTRMVEHHGTIQKAASASGLALRYFQQLRAKHRS